MDFSEENQYKCNLCEKGYKYPGTLWMQKLTHDKDIQKQFYSGDQEQQKQSDQTELVQHKCDECKCNEAGIRGLK